MKNAKLASAVMTAAMIASVIGAPMVQSFADTKLVNSVGSVAEDITNETKVGQDVSQEKQSEYYGELSEDGSYATNVYATIGSQYSVIIPKTLIVDAGTKTSEYVVKVDGDIAGDAAVKVEAPTSFAMQQAGKADVTATITQDKSSWTFNEFEVMGNGSISAQDLSAGKWHGSFDFAIELTDANA